MRGPLRGADELGDDGRAGAGAQPHLTLRGRRVSLPGRGSCDTTRPSGTFGIGPADFLDAQRQAERGERLRGGVDGLSAQVGHHDVPRPEGDAGRRGKEHEKGHDERARQHQQLPEPPDASSQRHP